MNCSGRSNAPAALWRPEKQFLSQIFGQVVRNAVNIDKLDVDNPPPAQGIPGLGNPGLSYKLINQDVQMRIAIPLKLENGDVGYRSTKITLQISPELIENSA